MSQELSKAPIFDGIGYEPSFYSRTQAVAAKSSYDFTDFEPFNKDRKKKILVVCTEEKYMPMANGKKFATGNHPLETFVPILHYENAGFEVDFFTATGGSVKLELWALPLLDVAVSNIIEKYDDQLVNPKSLKDFVAADMKSDTEYVAVFIPGGHGAMLGLPESEDLKKALNWAVNRDKFVMALCHGPAALLAAGPAEDFPFKGYKINSFPDNIDVTLPESGYQPGEMPWFYGERLEKLGIEILNKDVSGACHTDRKLITGDSPLAANEFGKIGAKALVESIK
ncbi:MAG: DJ-1/PfpI family protein [Chitinophagaceae bacterium]|nr:DJ-1/PfpI family protein [Chitinophagaceae bacterium]